MNVAVKSGERKWVPACAIPNSLREFGHMPDLEAWNPGDLILTRSSNPDWVSERIQRIQADGYGEDAATWTHAAIYLGDGLMLCEAQFDPPHVCSVHVAKLFNYLGTHDLMVRRSLHAEAAEKGWAIATAAATKIGNAYDVGFIVSFAIKHFFQKDRALQEHMATASQKAFVCSSLYSTAHAYATGVSITDKTNGLCVPAFLATVKEPHMRDVEYDWLKIES